MRAFLALVLVSSASIACGPPCPTIQHTDPSRALRTYRGGRQPARVIRAEARVEQWGEEGRIRGTVLMFVQRPESVRFDAMTQFGPAAILTSDGERFSLNDLRENRYLTGPTCPENIARLLGIPLSGEEVTLFLLGDTPTIDAASEEIECTGDGTYLITIAGNDGRRQEIELNIRDQDREKPPEEQHLRLVRSEVFRRDGETEWRATFEDYEVIADPESTEGLGVALPMKVRFEHPAENADTFVRFEEIDLNAAPPDGAFTQDPRPGIAIEEVVCH